MNTVDLLLSNDERIFLSWDIAKTYNRQIQLDTEVEDFMWKHSARIREIHAHDIIKNFRSHQIVGDGEIDFTRYLELFKRPEVAVTFEVRPREAALLSRDRLMAFL
jgi:sugar phosphate isomerase/epimerase